MRSCKLQYHKTIYELHLGVDRENFPVMLQTKQPPGRLEARVGVSHQLGGNMDEPIKLWTGYEIAIEDGWEDHLTNALFGEVLFRTLKNGIAEDWDDGIHLVIIECERLCKVYSLSYLNLLRGVFRRMEKLASRRRRKDGDGGLPPFTESLN